MYPTNLRPSLVCTAANIYLTSAIVPSSHQLNQQSGPNLFLNPNRTAQLLKGRRSR